MKKNIFGMECVEINLWYTVPPQLRRTLEGMYLNDHYSPPYEVLSHSLYSTIKTTELPSRVDFFATGIGDQSPPGEVQRLISIEDTNLNHGYMLPRQWIFLVEEIYLSSSDNVILSWIIELEVGTKTYETGICGPLFPFRIDIAVQRRIEGFPNTFCVSARPLDINKSQELDHHGNFTLRCEMHGLLLRPVV